MLEIFYMIFAGMAELADALDLGSSGAIHAGSIPVTRTKPQNHCNTMILRFFINIDKTEPNEFNL